MKKIALAILFIVIMVKLFATHNRAGEITYKQLSDLRFEITVVTYTSTGPGPVADRPDLEIYWGDDTFGILPRVEETILPDYYKRNVYVGEHTYSGPGIFEIVVEDPNRNDGVNNIPNSVNTVFSITTTMMINPEIGINNTPILTQAPVDKAAVGRIFVHNPGAYDPDGDSISYELTVCRSEDGEPIEGYIFPAASQSLSINAITGDLTWNTPVAAGVYNIAILIHEWRNCVKIGQIIRDMQIEVHDTDNTPPKVNTDDAICIEADSLLTYIVKATDSDGDNIKLTATGAPFVVEGTSASFYQTINEPGVAEAEFRWQTRCLDVRTQTYGLNIKAEDNSSPISLVDIKSTAISVVGPATENLNAIATISQINLSWEPNRCTNVVGYNIYRKISMSGFIPEHCEIGVPEELGFENIAYIDGYGINTYEDITTSQGYEYCYLITAVFPDGIEGYASNEACAELIRGIPTITNVSVTNTNETDGEIYIAWAKPTEIEIADAPGPYQYVLYRSEGYYGENLIEIATLNNINDTIFIDNGIDTKNKAYSYKVEFYNNEPSNRFLIGTPHIASSVFIEFQQLENSLKLIINKNTPWQNSEYVIYKYSNYSGNYDSIAASTNEYYIDANLINGNEYCYYVKSIGSYNMDGIVNPIINLSQKNCETVIDITPPCPPKLSGHSICDSTNIKLSWIYNDTCNNDIKHYSIYYTPYLDGEYKLIYTAEPHENSFDYFPELGMAGCYYMTATDSTNNVSPNSNRICLDDCIYYELPNVFTPNGDGHNDFFIPVKPYYFVNKIDIQIYNRWGQLLYQTNDPEIMWDGRNFRNEKIVSDGVYYYTCDVYEQRLTGEEIRHLNGFIHVFNASETQQTSSE